MGDYNPSQIALLILGYLEKVKCIKTWHTFLEESVDLQEHNYLKHKRCLTDVGGESLLDILKVYPALKISSTSSTRSDADQFSLPFYSSLIPFKGTKENSLQSGKNCEKTIDKNIQTDLFSCDCLQKFKEKSIQLVGTSEERNEYLKNNVSNLTLDQKGNRNKLSILNSTEQRVTQVLEDSKHSDSASIHSLPKSSSSFKKPLSHLTVKNNGREELGKNIPPQRKSLQAKQNLCKDPSLSKNLQHLERPLKLTNSKNGTTKRSAGHLAELPEIVKSSFDKCDHSDSNISSNIDLNVKQYANYQSEISSISAETNKYTNQYTEVIPCDLSVKEAVKLLTKRNETKDSTANSFAFQKIPSDNNSSCLNSKHDLTVVKEEIDSDNEMHDCDTEINTVFSKINETRDCTTNSFALQKITSDNSSSCINNEHDLQINIKKELDRDNEMHDCDTEMNTVISKINETRDCTTNSFALQKIPSDNSSSCINNEHDLQNIKKEIDSDNEMNVVISGITSLNKSKLHSTNMSLERSNTVNKFISHQNNQSSQKENKCILSFPTQSSSLTNSYHSVEKSSAMSTRSEMIKQSKTATENPGLVLFPNNVNYLNAIGQSEKSSAMSTGTEKIKQSKTATGNPGLVLFPNNINYLNTIGQSVKQSICETNRNTNANESHDVVKSTGDFILMNKSQYSTVISPPNQSSTVLSYATVPEFTGPIIPSDLSAQNNIQYQIVLNTPISWNGLSLVSPQGLSTPLSLVPSLPLSNDLNPPVVSPASTTAVPTVPLTNAFSQTSVSSTAVSQVVNVKSVLRNKLLNTTRRIPVITKIKSEMSDAAKQKAKQKNCIVSNSTTGKRTYSKRLPKRKLRPLFPSSLKGIEVPLAETILVLSKNGSACKSSTSKAIAEIISKFAYQKIEPKCKTFKEPLRKSQRIANKVAAASIKEFLICENIEPMDEI